MKIQEMYTTVQGELPLIGKPCFVIRLAGCNLNCPYCDAEFNSGVDLTIDEILDKVERAGLQNILITGGEPLLQLDAVQKLAVQLNQRHHTIVLETNGTQSVIPVIGLIDHIALDYKLFEDPSKQPFRLENIPVLSSNDVIKCVYQNEEEFIKAIVMIRTLPQNTPAMIVLSPTDSQHAYADGVIALQVNRPDLDIRIQVQIHKILNLG